MRLDRLVCREGLTRSEAHRLIRSGQVAVDGKPVNDPAFQPDLDACKVTLRGKAVRTDAHFYLMVNKPAGVVTATSDTRDKTVIDLLPPEWRNLGLGPVGRLDKDVTGLVILTTDGELAHRLISPKWDMEKLYQARVTGVITPDDVKKAAEGIVLKDFTCKGARLELVESGGDTCICRIAVTEGKFHQVKRMLSALGHEVLSLTRLSVAGIDLDPSLGSGRFRELTADEKAHLYTATGLEVPG